MHDEVGQKQTEDYQKRLQKLKEEEVSFIVSAMIVYNFNEVLVKRRIDEYNQFPWKNLLNSTLIISI